MTGWNAWGDTDVGMMRERNEDVFVVGGDAGCYLVADGMGGHRGGGVASAMARDAVLAALHDKAEMLAADPAGALAGAMRAANAAVFHAGGRQRSLMGMGTTLSILRLREGGGWAAHAGDSRIYRLDVAGLDQLTTDHSEVGRLVRAGLLTPEEGRRSPAGHWLTTAVGIGDAIAADVFPVETATAEAFLLCSDGLSGPVDDMAIATILRGHAPDPKAACEALIVAAMEAGGPDNVTVIVVFRADE